MSIFQKKTKYHMRKMSTIYNYYYDIKKKKTKYCVICNNN